MTRIDRRHARGEQRDKRRLRPLQYERRLIIAIGGDLREVVVPGLARVDAKLLGCLALQQIPRAFDVSGGEPLAVMPLHALAQMKGEAARRLRPTTNRSRVRAKSYRGCSALRADCASAAPEVSATAPKTPPD